ncbi:MAG: VCBS repeat-containing protein, partial [candidate division WOR-3 bacterium]
MKTPLILSASVALAFGSLGYVESSGGLHDSLWEGGRTEFEFADIDDDGNVDIISIGDHGNPGIQSHEHGVMVYFGDGTGRWSMFEYGNFGYGGIAVGDVNWDGDWDIGYGMHHNYSGVDLGDDMLEVALGNGTGRMWTAWDDSLVPGGSVWGMFATDFGDIDNDGDLDIGSTSFGSGVGLRVFLNNGDGTWHQTFDLGTRINSTMQFYFRDVNRDGNSDIIHGSAGPAVYFGDGAGGFVAGDSGLPQTTYGLSGISPGDIDNDGGSDLAFANADGGIEAWIWNPVAGRWQNRSSGLPSSGSWEATQLFDMDCDGFTDLVSFGRSRVTVWTGDGAGNWTEATGFNTPTPGYHEALRAGADFDHNGRPDIVLLSEEGSFPNYQNWVHAYRETTAARVLGIRPVFPRGREKFMDGSVQFIDWWSEAPGAESTRVRLELSLSGPDGPWTEIADSLRNNGRFQWLVPEDTLSPDCRIRYTVYGPGRSAQSMTPRSFAIGDTFVALTETEPRQPSRPRVWPNPTRGRISLEPGYGTGYHAP